MPTHTSARRLTSTAVLAWLLASAVAVLVGPQPAYAATTLSPRAAETSTSVALTVRATEDRTGDFSARVALTVPDEFTLQACTAPAGWTCSQGSQVVTWTRSAAAPLTLLTADLGATMTTPDDATEATFTISQTYTSGFSDRTSPSFRVVAPDPDPTAEPSPEPGPSPEPAPSATAPEAADDDDPFADEDPFDDDQAPAQSGPRPLTLGELMANGDAFIVAAPGDPDEKAEGGVSATAPTREGLAGGQNRDVDGSRPLVLLGILMLAVTAGVTAWQAVETDHARRAS